MVTLVVAKLIAYYSPATAFKVASGLVSHQICSSTFVSHQNPDEAFGRIPPTLGPRSWVGTYDLDYQQSVVSARIAGLAYSRAIYRQAEGCLVQIGAPPAAPAVVSPSKGSRGIIPNAGPGTALVKSINSALALPINQQFYKPNHPPHRLTTPSVALKD